MRKKPAPQTRGLANAGGFLFPEPTDQPAEAPERAPRRPPARARASPATPAADAPAAPRSSRPSRRAPASVAGHRDRLRARFLDAGPDALADYELLELFLSRVIPRADTKALAKALILRCGDLAGVFAADQRRLAEVDGAGPAVILELKAMQAAFERAARIEAQRRPVVSSWNALVGYLRAGLQHEAREQFRMLFLDRKNQMIRDETMGRGTIDQAPVYPREVARRALELDAAAVILVHNHPSGDPNPSAADVAITRETIAACKAVGVGVHDHVIVGRHGVASFKSLGLI
jgi:DNA repair protein RadC